jgi:hypothetical protein
VTGLRLKALHLATSPDFTYSNSYLGLLSAIGCMLSIVLCVTPILPILFRKVKERGRTDRNLTRYGLENSTPTSIPLGELDRENARESRVALRELQAESNSGYQERPFGLTGIPGGPRRPTVRSLVSYLW